MQNYPYIGLQVKILNNTYMYRFDNKASSLSHWLAAMLQPTIIDTDDEEDAAYAASVLKKKSFFVINYCNQSLDNFESQFSEYRGQILVASVKKQQLCNETQPQLYAQRNNKKYYFDNNTSLRDFILQYKNRAVGPISIEEYRQWIQERKLGLLIVDPFQSQEIVEEMRQITDDYGLNLAYIDIGYYKFKSLFDKLGIDESSDLPIFVVIDNIVGRHYLQHVDNTTQIIEIIEQLNDNPQMYQTLETSDDENVIIKGQDQMRKLIDNIKFYINKANQKILIATGSLFALITIILCIISCNKHKK